MFFLLVLEKNIRMHPRDLPGRQGRLSSRVEAVLRNEVEGTCRGRYGFVVAVTEMKIIGKGLISPDGSGFVTFRVRFKCVVTKPCKGENIEAVVTNVSPLGFSAEAGPVEIFVSNQNMPEGFEYQNGETPSYTWNNEGAEPVRIQEDTDVRIKIFGTKIEFVAIFCVGSIVGDYLGVIAEHVPAA